MRLFLGTVFGAIAVGVLLIAYGLLGPRSTMKGPMAGADGETYQLAQPASEHLTLRDDANWAAASHLQLRCESGQRAMIRQVQGVVVAECVDAAVAERYGSMRTTPVSYELNAPRPVRAFQSAPAPQRTASSRVEGSSGRDWKKTALVIGGSTAVGAGVGAIFGGKKGALIGAALGGGASTLYEVKH